MVSSLPPLSSVTSAKPPVWDSTRVARFRKLSTSASRLAVGPQMRQRSSSASWEACSGTSKTCGRCRRCFSSVSSTSRLFPAPARPIHICNFMPRPPLLACTARSRAVCAYYTVSTVQRKGQFPYGAKKSAPASPHVPMRSGIGAPSLLHFSMQSRCRSASRFSSVTVTTRTRGCAATRRRKALSACCKTPHTGFSPSSAASTAA